MIVSFDHQDVGDVSRWRLRSETSEDAFLRLPVIPKVPAITIERKGLQAMFLVSLRLYLC